MKKAIQRLTLHNFQSHEDTILDFKDGVNVIVGASDVGKTSVIRALRWLYYNQPRGTGFIRMGTSDCWVEIETEDQIIVRRYRNEATRKNGYWLVHPGQEPLVFEKHGANVPEEIRLALGVEEIAIDQDAAINLNIAYQLDGAFLLEEPGTIRAKAIGRLGDAHIVDAAQREIQRDLRALNQDIESRKSQLAEEEKTLANYKHLADWEARIKELNSLWAEHKQRESLQSNLQDWLAKYQSGNQQKDKLVELLADLNGINEAETNLITLQTGRNTAEQLTNLQQQNQVKKSSYELQIGMLRNTENLENGQVVIAKLGDLLKQLQNYNELKQKREQTSEAIEKSRATIIATASIEDALRVYETAKEAKDDLGRLSQLDRDHSSKQTGLNEASQRLMVTKHLEKGEDLIHQLANLRELGFTYNEIWRNYRQREEQQRNIKQKLDSLSQCDTADGKLLAIMNLGNRWQLLSAHADKYKLLTRELDEQEQKLLSWQQTYHSDIDTYLDCLSSVGECPVCHGRIDEQHLQELRNQLIEEWGNE